MLLELTGCQLEMKPESPTPAQRCAAMCGQAGLDVASFERFQRGPRKGQLKNTAVPGTERTFIFSMSEFDALKLDWEKSSGECSECEGNGDTVAYASANETRYRICKRCGGSGKAVAE